MLLAEVVTISVTIDVDISVTLNVHISVTIDVDISVVQFTAKTVRTF